MARDTWWSSRGGGGRGARRARGAARARGARAGAAAHRVRVGAARPRQRGRTELPMEERVPIEARQRAAPPRVLLERRPVARRPTAEPLALAWAWGPRGSLLVF